MISHVSPPLPTNNRTTAKKALSLSLSRSFFQLSLQIHFFLATAFLRLVRPRSLKHTVSYRNLFEASNASSWEFGKLNDAPSRTVPYEGGGGSHSYPSRDFENTKIAFDRNAKTGFVGNPLSPTQDTLWTNYSVM